MSLATAVVLGALVLDVVVGEPPEFLHPVRWFGRAVEPADRPWQRPRLAGVILALLFPIVAATVSSLLVVGIATRSTVAGLGFAALVLFAATSFRALLGTAWRVCGRAESDLEAARRDLSALAGRDAADFDAGQIRSAALESLAENLADGLVAPLSGFVLGAGFSHVLGFTPEWTLAFACAGAVWLKSVNTLDSMWGYPDRSFGTGAARLDDVAMWIPARLTAALLAGSFLAPRSISRADRWVADVPSPNAGWPMGTLAAALGVRLEKPGVYVLNPAGEIPTRAHVEPALRRLGLAGLGAYALAGVVLWS
jgi:adenosylcobinamide-phosphate synthase